ncbi:MAG: GxxExxY protein [Candidatus Magasanikbacteria bacterium]|nr:GxxExxY protein [Candidatus Magasanikbacteria bacterium]
MIQGGESKVVYPNLSFKIVGILFDVYNIVGSGYLERHYQKALEFAFTDNDIKYLPQAPYRVRYKEKVIGRYFMDFIIEDKIVLEIKRNDHFSRNDFNQLVGYLKATGYKLGILASFSSRGLKFKRVLNIN